MQAERVFSLFQIGSSGWGLAAVSLLCRGLAPFNAKPGAPEFWTSEPLVGGSNLPLLRASLWDVGSGEICRNHMFGITQTGFCIRNMRELTFRLHLTSPSIL